MFFCQNRNYRINKCFTINLLCKVSDDNFLIFPHLFIYLIIFFIYRGWSDGAMVLGKLPVPGRPTNLVYSRVRAYCAHSRCGWGLFGHFFSTASFLSSFSLSLGDSPI